LLFIIAIHPLQRILDLDTQGLLIRIGADTVKIRMSFYTNDTTLFVRPIAADITNMHFLLQQFGNNLARRQDSRLTCKNQRFYLFSAVQ
jgi:hypothetical protein